MQGRVIKNQISWDRLADRQAGIPCQFPTDIFKEQLKEVVSINDELPTKSDKIQRGGR